jgi:hypothetical protein
MNLSVAALNARRVMPGTSKPQGLPFSALHPEGAQYFYVRGGKPALAFT